MNIKVAAFTVSEKSSNTSATNSIHWRYVSAGQRATSSAGEKIYKKNAMLKISNSQVKAIDYLQLVGLM